MKQLTSNVHANMHYQVEERIDFSDLRDQLEEVSNLELMEELESTVMQLVASAIDAGFAAGWTARENPSTILFEN